MQHSTLIFLPCRNFPFIISNVSSADSLTLNDINPYPLRHWLLLTGRCFQPSQSIKIFTRVIVQTTNTKVCLHRVKPFGTGLNLLFSRIELSFCESRSCTDNLWNIFLRDTRLFWALYYSFCTSHESLKRGCWFIALLN